MATKPTFLRTQLNHLSTPLNPPPHFLSPTRTDTPTPLPPRHVLTALEKLQRLHRTHHTRSYPTSSLRHILTQLSTLYLLPPDSDTPDPELQAGTVFYHPGTDIITHLESAAGIGQLPISLPDIDDLEEEQKERLNDSYLNLKAKLERLENVVGALRAKREGLRGVKERVLELVEQVEGGRSESEDEMEIDEEDERGKKRIQEDVVGVGGGGWNEELEGIKGEAVSLGGYVAGLEVEGVEPVEEEKVKRRDPVAIGRELLRSKN